MSETHEAPARRPGGLRARAERIGMFRALDDAGALHFVGIGHTGDGTVYIFEINGARRSLPGRDAESYALAVADMLADTHDVTLHAEWPARLAHQRGIKSLL